MPLRTWIIAASIGLICTSSGWGQEQPAAEDEPRQEDSASDADRSPQEADPNPLKTVRALEDIEAAIRQLKADVDEKEANRARESATRDLRAQEGMAWWAKLMFYATAATVILTAFALWAIVRTLHHTQLAAISTEGMLREAEKTTAASMGMFRSERAWMLFGSTMSRPTGPSQDVVEGILFSIQFRNYGRTPAKNATVGSMVSYSLKDVKEYVDGFWEGTLDPSEGSIVAPQQTLGAQYRRVPIQDIAKMYTGEIEHIFVCGVSKYYDTFGNLRLSSVIRQGRPITEFETLCKFPYNPNEYWVFSVPYSEGDKCT